MIRGVLQQYDMYWSLHCDMTHPATSKLSAYRFRGRKKRQALRHKGGNYVRY